LDVHGKKSDEHEDEELDLELSQAHQPLDRHSSFQDVHGKKSDEHEDEELDLELSQAHQPLDRHSSFQVRVLVEPV
ncbi:hypothetical protein HAX54_012930, partial [Datura stramonium]|nr:hypothetical protein [Datura stramonium]